MAKISRVLEGILEINKRSLLLLILLPHILRALPQGGQVAAGNADFVQNEAHSLAITTSDKAIINYQSFNIGELESVQFVQPSSSSCVLNRVQEGNPSSILGSLKGNGKVFLVNPDGIYFGPKASVNVGSFVASTLDILDQDFLNENYTFFHTANSKGSEIYNQGEISSLEGSIVLLAPFVRNEGVISALTDKVLVTSGEKVTLDFTGDGLVSFAVEGDLEEALIENSGKIQAVEGQIYLRTKAASRVIREILNTEGVEEATKIIKEKGCVRLVPSSYVRAKNVEISGDEVALAGTLDVSNKQAKGGGVVVAGRDIRIENMQLDPPVGAVGIVNLTVDSSGGALLNSCSGTSGIYSMQASDINEAIGDVILCASNTIQINSAISMQNPVALTLQAPGGGTVTTTINADIATLGDIVFGPPGSTNNVILGTNTTISSTTGNITFNGTVDGPYDLLVTTTSGDVTFLGDVGGGIPLTQLEVDAQKVTLSGATYTTNSGYQIFNAPLLLDNDVSLSTNGGAIEFLNTIDGTVSGYSLTLDAGSSGPITFDGIIGGVVEPSLLIIQEAGDVEVNATLNAGAIIQSQGSGTTSFEQVDLNAGSLELIGTHFFFSGAVSISNSGGVTVGHSGVLTVTSSADLVIDGPFTQSGTGTVSAAGNISAASISFGSPVTLKGNTSYDTSAANGDIDFSSTIDGAYALTLNAGTGTVHLSADVGDSTPLASFTIESGASATIQNIKTTQGPISIAPGVTLGASATLDTTDGGLSPLGAAISLSSIDAALSGTQTLAIEAGSRGSITLTGDIGSGTPLGGVDVITGSGLFIQNITTDAGPIQLQIPATLSLTTTTTFDTTAGGGSATGGNITLAAVDGTIPGQQPLTLNGGTGGTIALNGALGANVPLGAITIEGASATIGNMQTAGGQITIAPTASIGADVLLNTTASLSSGAAISFGSSVSGAHNLTLNAGVFSVAFAGLITLGDTAANTSLTVFSGSNLSFPSTLTTAGGLSASGNVIFTGNTTIHGAISVSGLTAATGSQTISLLGGGTVYGAAQFSNTGALTLYGGSSTPLLFMAGVDTTLGGGSAPLHLANTIQTSGGTEMTLGSGSQEILLDADTTLSAPNSSPILINLGGSLNGAQKLAANAGIQTITVTGNIGAATAPTALTLNALNLNLNASSYKTTGAQSYTGTVALGTTASFDTTNGGASSGAAITFNSAVGGTSAGSQGLTISAGGGTVTFAAALGGVAGANNVSALGAVTINSAAEVKMGGNLTTQTGAFSSAAPITLLRALSLDTTNGLNGSGANVTFNNTVDGAEALVVTVGGETVAFNASIGGNTPIASFSTTAGAIQVASNITTSGGGIKFQGPVTLSSGAVTLNSSGGDVNFLNSNTTLDGAEALTVIASNGDVTFDGLIGSLTLPTSVTVSSSKNITFSTTAYKAGAQSYTSSGNFNLTAGAPTSFLSEGGAITFSTGTMQLTGNTSLSVDSTNGGAVPAGGSVTLPAIMRSDTSGAPLTITVNAGLDNDALTGALGTGYGQFDQLSLTGKDVGVQGDVFLNSISLNPSAAGNILLGGGIFTANTSMTFTNPVVLTAANSVTVSTGSSGANISFNSPINMGSSGGLSLAAGTGSLCLLGAVSTSGVGGSQPFTVQGAKLIPCADISVNNGTVTFDGPTTLMSSITVNSGTGFGDVNFLNSIDGTVLDQQNLTILAGQGNVTLSGAVGQNIPLSDITIITSGTVTAGNINVDPPIVIYGADIILNGTEIGTSLLLQATGSILGSFTAVITDDATFNALGGSVGSSSTPINLQVGGKVFAGAKRGALFTGSTGDGTVHFSTANPPLFLLFNGTVLLNRFFSFNPVEGIYSSTYNLADYFYFIENFYRKAQVRPAGPLLFSKF